MAIHRLSDTIDFNPNLAAVYMCLICLTYIVQEEWISKYAMTLIMQPFLVQSRNLLGCLKTKLLVLAICMAQPINDQAAKIHALLKSHFTM